MIRQILDKLTCVPVLLAGLIMPGEGVGPVTLDMSRGTLSEAVGEQNLADITVQMGEGFTREGTSVWAGTDSALVVVWIEPETPGIYDIRVLGPAWQTVEGLHQGMHLTEVDSIIGEFELLGFAWDYQGFSDLSEAGLDDGMWVRFDTGELSGEGDWETMMAVSGDRWFSSRNPDMVALDPVIEVISVYRQVP